MKAKNQEPESEFASMIPKDVKFDLPSGQKEEQKTGSSSPRRLDSPRSLLKVDETVAYGFQRNPELWEYSDGCVYLLRELSSSSLKTYVQQYLPVLPELGLLD